MYKSKEFKQKYIKYKSKYINLKKMSGGNIIEPYDYKNKMDVDRYVQQITNVEPASGSPSGRPYLLVLYGPPASGKTFAKKFIINKLGLSDNYIYISEDRFAYDTIQFNQLQSTDLSDLKNIPKYEIEKHEKIISLQEAYNSIRKQTKFIMYPLLGSALMFKTNVVLEMTGVGLDWYMATMIDEFYHYKYDIYVVYPFTYDIDFLFNRSVDRGFKEKRFLPSKYFAIAVERSMNNFQKILNDDNIKKFKEIYVYDTKNIDNKGNNIQDNILLHYVNGNIIKGSRENLLKIDK
ncbi:hypothetical protein QJ856_gp0705 [Tupanvirus deep ocean]|uniref:Uncharacterized protein n=2 Tax=Tupanvirus TaxID=2094720 RepID=A0AC62A8E4_9VIRU|nr:hypothetical protein QJ856_gp0705 [Tupanvirus deep ocean]QKU34046.1 hypothetical protein [Tupanvirus deep ocean]